MVSTWSQYVWAVCADLDNDHFVFGSHSVEHRRLGTETHTVTHQQVGEHCSSLTCRMVSPVSCGARLSSCSPDRERRPSDHTPRRSATQTNTHTSQALCTMLADSLLTYGFCRLPGIPSDQLHTHPTLPQPQNGHLNSLAGRVPHAHQPYKHQTVEVHTTRHSYHCESVSV